LSTPLLCLPENTCRRYVPPRSALPILFIVRNAPYMRFLGRRRITHPIAKRRLPVRQPISLFSQFKRGRVHGLRAVGHAAELSLDDVRYIPTLQGTCRESRRFTKHWIRCNLNPSMPILFRGNGFSRHSRTVLKISIILLWRGKGESL